ncbi:family 20 glycosylhydrolase [Paenibacillus whitsoniae]|uniref:beta-N-acetylhexosaminidase n=1 Tax=Paenibacillus whitsoniae TaxID=2496558 RepID=A0A3S0CCY2_9BACL|nr:family 20 glycosylhydrolase [Paenibacillus whitsoniae]RTE11086.1 hypothetical protein EJQ19_03925 [Paenibacillus whitsoniae]
MKNRFVRAIFAITFSLLLFTSLSAWANAEQAATIIPKPVTYTTGSSTFTLTSSTSIYVQGTNAAQTDEIYKIGQYLAGKLSPATGFAFNVVKSSTPPAGSIYLTTIGGNAASGQEGYTLNTSISGVNLTAYTPEGLFRGIQTLRQMLPPDIEKSSLVTGVPWIIQQAAITDAPTYPWRGHMLDVARHFFTVDNVKRVIDLMAQYKMNILHLHLTDDQGWRIQINSWPDLATIGGSTQVGGGAGGYYTQAQYTDIINYAKDRYITVVPEIDLPGHVNAALASYGELNPDGQKKSLYTGTSVGFSTLMTQAEITYTFIDDVIGELADITPGPYIHIGGDEASSTNQADYDYFIGRVKTIVANHGKTMIGWNPALRPDLATAGSLLQNWSPTVATDTGIDYILSPKTKAYMDYKYDSSNPIGQTFAGYNPTDDAYQWDPTDFAPQSSVKGIEAPLWTETIRTMADIEYMSYPRIPGHAEIGWTPKSMRDWNEYKYRLAAQGPRMTNEGIHYYPDPVVPWSSSLGANIALNKPVTASSTETSSFPAAYAVDSSSNTRWSSLRTDPQWLQVDLGATYTINRVVLNWEAAYGKSFQIQVSPDASNWTTIYSTTTGTGGIQDLTGLSGSGRYIRMYGTARGTQYGYSLYDFQVYGVLTSLSLNQPVTASSVETSAFPAAYAVDGNSSTRWSSLRTDSEWIYVDLGSSKSVKQVKLNWEAAYGKAYKIQVSNDAVNWTDVFTTTTGDGGMDDISFTPVSARYVRMVGSLRGTAYGYSLWDFEVY